MLTHRPVLLGHRGASKYAPENTIAAFDLALQHGCDGFEFDIRYTSDARSVICHDPLYEHKRIEKSQFCDLHLPAADDVIRRYLSFAYLDIELKVLGDVADIIEAVKRQGTGRYLISSFLPAVLEELHSRDSEVPSALICENERQLKRWNALPIRAVMVHRRLASAALVEEVHAARKQVFVWTVNQQREMLRLAGFGVDGLISDDTKLLASTFNQS